MNLFSIITRTCRRPKALAACIASIQGQDFGDVQHLILRDEIGLGVDWANGMMADRDWSDLAGEWIYILDDDNCLAPGALQAIHQAASQARLGAGHDLLIARIDRHGKGEPFPPDEFWGIRPRLAKIDAGNVVMRRDLFLQAVRYYTPAYSGDFDYIQAGWRLAGSVGWLDRIIMRMQKISHGVMEYG